MKGCSMYLVNWGDDDGNIWREKVDTIEEAVTLVRAALIDGYWVTIGVVKH
jgi:hypothetical protein